MARLRRRAALALVLLAAARASDAQQLRRTDVFAQDDLASTGLASDSLCIGKGSQTPGGFDPLPELSGARKRPIHFAAAAIALAERVHLEEEKDDPFWRGGGIAQFRAHGATQCHFDGTVRALGGSGGIGADALAVVHWPGVLGGALHAFAEAAATNDSTSSDRLDVPRGAALGAAYTTFNLLELVPVFRSPEGRPRLDLRARLSANALYEYAGDARRLHGKSIVPEYGATAALVVHEVINSGLLYSTRIVPGWISPASGLSSGSRVFWEQTVVLDHAVLRQGGTSWLSRHEPFIGARYTWRRLGSLDKRIELALHAGVHLD